MKKIFKEFYDQNVYIKNQKSVHIDNYKKLSYISEQLIIIDNIQIKGNNLYVCELDSFQIQVEGAINEISFI